MGCHLAWRSTSSIQVEGFDSALPCVAAPLDPVVLRALGGEFQVRARGWRSRWCFDVWLIIGLNTSIAEMNGGWCIGRIMVWYAVVYVYVYVYVDERS